MSAWAAGAPLPPEGEPFAVLHRPGAGRPDVVEILSGPVRGAETLAGLDLDGTGGQDTRATLLLAPYRQILERGFDAPDDGERLLAMDVRERRRMPLMDFLGLLPERAVNVEGARFDMDDEAYAAAAGDLVRREIHGGAGSNFVLARSLRGRIRGFDRTAALAVLRRLLTAESGAYWTFLVYTGERYLIGSPPEQHVRVRGAEVSMNPISGTYRYPVQGAELPGLLRFLRDAKETHELYMVVDEELKMMTALCGPGVTVSGPSLKWMSRLAHTEYFLHGRSGRPMTEILRTTMPAPTVTGSPLENACRVIARYEPGGRGYYSGVIALVERARGERSLDSAIVLRTADIAEDGSVQLAAGATVVRDSVPREEAMETSAKVAGFLGALSRPGGVPSGVPAAPSLAAAPAVRAALEARNAGVAGFWLDGPAAVRGGGGGPVPAGVPVTIVDAEDRFTWMLAHQLRSLGCAVEVVPWREAAGAGGVAGAESVVLLGPGPGDPRDGADARVAALRSLAGHRLAHRLPLAAVCLGHQVVCGVLGLPLVRLAEPRQGHRMRVPLWGEERLVGFYNSFTARADDDWTGRLGHGRDVQVQRGEGGEVIALRGPGLSTIQFHAESFLTEDGPRILQGLVNEALWTASWGRALAHGRGEDTYEHA
ncbi:anthranilate synthase family protein [Streptomyces purpureus]|uniref:anthranilate synthase family protein n=1 Tax=Streptomyces purpureus TaxID=1951 RepID=UPI00037E7D78|nr:anthranilate synthase family protein [Streptomyces purpureus]